MPKLQIGWDLIGLKSGVLAQLFLKQQTVTQMELKLRYHPKSANIGEAKQTCQNEDLYD